MRFLNGLLLGCIFVGCGAASLGGVHGDGGTDSPDVTVTDLGTSTGLDTYDARSNEQVTCLGPSDSTPPGSSNVIVVPLPAASFAPPGTEGGGVTLAPPPAGSTGFAVGTYVLTIHGDCPEGTVVHWGEFNYTSSTPAGTSITFIVHAASTQAELSAGTPVPLSNAPVGIPLVPSSVDLTANLIAWAPTQFLNRDAWLSITATLDPSPDRTMAPTLGCTELQFTCEPLPDAGSP